MWFPMRRQPANRWSRSKMARDALARRRQKVCNDLNWLQSRRGLCLRAGNRFVGRPTSIDRAPLPISDTLFSTRVSLWYPKFLEQFYNGAARHRGVRGINGRSVGLSSR
ncbi:MAG: hypothetical protein CMM00_09505 [Rhodopirellula sp.]|nr:hypothetical protein [Rhodopirellula sp.]